MHLEVSMTSERSESAGAKGMFQIESVRDAGTGDVLSGKIDPGIHFGSFARLGQHLIDEFGQDTTFEIID